MGDIARKNHFVTNAYINNFKNNQNKILVYNILVSHEKVPYWSPKSPSGSGFFSDLYTRTLPSNDETDELERWLATEVDEPGILAINKALSEGRLLPEDWRSIIRFLAAQDIRTPNKYLEVQKLFNESFSDTTHQVVNEVIASRLHGQTVEVDNKSDAIRPPIKSQIVPVIQKGKLGIKTEMLIGRELWLSQFKRFLTKTVEALFKQKWTILKPSEGYFWFTTDDPVIKLNYYGEGQYDFKGGWGNHGTDIFMPLSPEYLLFTQIGHRPPLKGKRFSQEKTQFIRKVMAEHAFRQIYSHQSDSDVPQWRPRHVDEVAYKHEKEQRDKWHILQTEAEKRFWVDDSNTDE